VAAEHDDSNLCELIERLEPEQAGELREHALWLLNPAGGRFKVLRSCNGPQQGPGVQARQLASPEYCATCTRLARLPARHCQVHGRVFGRPLGGDADRAAWRATLTTPPLCSANTSAPTSPGSPHPRRWMRRLYPAILGEHPARPARQSLVPLIRPAVWGPQVLSGRAARSAR
jgi:hypothetical protein